MSDVLTSLAVGLLTAAVVMTAAALVARAVGRVAVVDVAWGLGFVAIAVTTAVVVGRRRDPAVAGAGPGGGVGAPPGLAHPPPGRRLPDRGRSPRYERLLGGPVREVGFAVAVRKVFLVQGVAMWFISLPVQVGAALSVRWWPVVVAGSVLWLVGLVFEAVGDAQLAAYKRDPDRGPVMDRGLWRWTRHPNYFGDACVWWGLWLVGGLASGWLPGLLTVLAPVAMTYFLVFATGARLLEQTMMKRPGYPEYAARTSMFFPRPPRS